MSSTLVVEVGGRRFEFGPPEKNGIARAFYDHDGSGGGYSQLVNTQDLLDVVVASRRDGRIAENAEYSRLHAILNAIDSPDYATLSWKV